MKIINKIPNENPATVLTPLVRYALIALCGGLITKGYITAEQVNTLTGLVVAGITTAWMFAVKAKHK